MAEKIKDHSKINEDHKNNTISISLQSVRELKSEIGLIAVFKNTFKYYKIRRVTNKGAILVLLLSYLVSSIYYLFYDIIVSNLHHSTKIYFCLWLITFSVSASLSGWLADAFIGRYKVIKNSVLIMWLFLVLATVSVIISQFADSYYHLITEVLILSNSGYFVVTILIVLNEIIIYPNINRCTCVVCCPRIKSLSKVIIGAFLYVLCLLLLIVLDVLSRHIQLDNNGYNATLECDLYQQSGIQKGKLSTVWLVLTSYLQDIAFLFIMIGIIEFLYSQSPYSMRGLIFGMQYMLMILLPAPAVIIIEAFSQHFSIWGTKAISCGFWYMLTVIVIYSIVWAIFLYLTKKYKMRKREDVLPNEHIFAERYYETLET